MKKSRFTDEQIVTIVRESHARGVSPISENYEVSELTIYLWRKKFGTMDVPRVAEFKRIQIENSQLMKLVAEHEQDQI